jgi:hypothetical protein
MYIYTQEYSICMYIYYTGVKHVYVYIYSSKAGVNEEYRRSKAKVKHWLQVKHGATLTTPGLASSLVSAMLCFSSIKSLHKALIKWV